jgi:hypothetical protein
VSATVQVSDTPEPDLIDRIANDLPAEVPPQPMGGRFPYPYVEHERRQVAGDEYL